MTVNCNKNYETFVELIMNTKNNAIIIPIAFFNDVAANTIFILGKTK